MNSAAEQFIEANKANLQNLARLTTQVFSGLEKLVELNMAAGKALLADSMSQAQAALAAKNGHELLALQAGFFKPMAEKSAAYAQHLQTIVADSKTEFTKALEAQAAEAQKAFNEAVEGLVKNAPAGAETAVAAFKNALTAGQSAAESVQASVKNVAEAAQSSFTSAAAQTVTAAKKAAKSAA